MTKQETAGRKRVYNPEALRTRVLDVAAEAFQARGYHSTSTHEIVRDAGVTGGALHHHFPNKKSLGIAVIRERVAKAVAQTWLSPVNSARTGVDGILKAFDQIARGLDECGEVRGCPLGNLAVELSCADPEFRSAIQDIYSGWQHAIANRLREDRARGLIDLDPEALSILIVASYSGAIALAKAEQSAVPLRTCARQLANIMKKQPPTRRA